MSAEAVRGSLPRSTSTIVGRSQVVSEVAALVRSRPLELSVRIAELDTLETTDGLAPVIRRAQAMRDGGARGPWRETDRG